MFASTSTLRLWRNRLGSVLIETLAVVPLFTVIWTAGVKGFEAYTRVLDGRRTLRSCAWQHAMSGCQAAPAGCQVGGGGAATEPPPALASALDTLAGRLPFLAGTLEQSLPAPGFVATVNGNPAGVGSFPLACDPLPGTETAASVFQQTCPLLGGYCP